MGFETFYGNYTLTCSMGRAELTVLDLRFGHYLNAFTWYFGQPSYSCNNNNFS